MAPRRRFPHRPDPAGAVSGKARNDGILFLETFRQLLNMMRDRNIKPGVQDNTSNRNTFQGLRSPGLFAKLPVIGLMMFLAGSLTFGLLAYQLRTNEGLLQWDLTIAKTFRDVQTNAPWSLMENLLFGCFVGKEVVILIGTILAVYFLHKRFWRELAMVVIGLGGGGLIWYFLSRSLDRPRPVDHLDVLLLSGPSFPSGPALLAVLCYGLLAYLLVSSLSSRLWKWFVALISILAILIVGLSSLLFGTHYASDVIAGLALGLAWAGVVYTLAERFFQEGIAGNQKSVQKATAFEGLRAPGLFKRRPILGFALILLGGLSFAALGYNVLENGSLVQLDTSVYKELLAQARTASPVLNDIMLFGFFVGKQAVQLIVMIFSLYFLYRRYWLEFAMLQISTQGGGVIKNFLIDYFARPRPPEQMGLGTTELPSFPSGHALGTIICYGFLAYLLVPKMPSLFWKWALSIAILSLVLFEGFSRIFHGNHYLTDVLASYALGIAWVVLVCTVMESIFMSRRAAE
jgi:undecaprenyl-diphosphatase